MQIQSDTLSIYCHVPSYICDVFRVAGGCGLESGRESDTSVFKAWWGTWNSERALGYGSDHGI